MLYIGFVIVHWTGLLALQVGLIGLIVPKKHPRTPIGFVALVLILFSVITLFNVLIFGSFFWFGLPGSGPGEFTSMAASLALRAVLVTESYMPAIVGLVIISITVIFIFFVTYYHWMRTRRFTSQFYSYLVFGGFFVTVIIAYIQPNSSDLRLGVESLVAGKSGTLSGLGWHESATSLCRSTNLVVDLGLSTSDVLDVAVTVIEKFNDVTEIDQLKMLIENGTLLTIDDISNYIEKIHPNWPRIRIFIWPFEYRNVRGLGFGPIGDGYRPDC